MVVRVVLTIELPDGLSADECSTVLQRVIVLDEQTLAQVGGRVCSWDEEVAS